MNQFYYPRPIKNCHSQSRIIQYHLEFEVETNVQPRSWVRPKTGDGLKVGVTAPVKEPPFQISWIHPCILEIINFMSKHMLAGDFGNVKFLCSYVVKATDFGKFGSL